MRFFVNGLKMFEVQTAVSVYLSIVICQLSFAIGFDWLVIRCWFYFFFAVLPEALRMRQSCWFSSITFSL